MRFSTEHLPIVKRALVEEVAATSKRQARMICKLVCYHDLVGDIVGKGRNPAELEAVAKTERQLNMLIAIAKADMRSVNPMWAINHKESIENLRQRVLAKIRANESEDA